jgi:glycosyltransferase involved in cell wall biosynthesis
MNLLFITWDGPGTTYHETLFIPLLARARRSQEFTYLLQLTWGDQSRGERIRRLAQAQGLHYDALNVPRGRCSLFMPFVLLWASVRIAALVRRGDIDTLMPRSTIPALCALLARRLASDKCHLIFDADGLEADEKVEFGGWRRGGLRHRLFASVERSAVRRADVVLVRTSRAAAILQERTGVPGDRFVIVCNGKDPRVYCPRDEEERRRVRANLGFSAAAPVVVYVGSIGPQYRLEQMADTFRSILAIQPEARWLVITPQSNHARVRTMCRGLPDGTVTILEADSDLVPRLLCVADLGLAFRSPTLSQQAVAPIKLGEYLLCGVPVAYTKRVGDLDSLQDQPPAFAIEDADPGAGRKVATWFSSEVLDDRAHVRAEARALGESLFTLERGARDYRSAFDRTSATDEA